MASNWFKKSISASLLALLATSCSHKSAAPLTPEATPILTASGIIVVGDISTEPAKRIERFQPFADYLAIQLNEIDIGVGEVKIAPDMETMAQ